MSRLYAAQVINHMFELGSSDIPESILKGIMSGNVHIALVSARELYTYKEWVSYLTHNSKLKIANSLYSALVDGYLGAPHGCIDS